MITVNENQKMQVLNFIVRRVVSPFAFVTVPYVKLQLFGQPNITKNSCRLVTVSGILLTIMMNGSIIVMIRIRIGQTTKTIQ